MNNKQITAYFRYSSAIFGLLLALTSCAPKTDDERIAAINKRIAPEGHLTKTHLYVDWPAEYEGGNEVAKPLKLKIPIEYLGQNLITFDNAAKIEQHELGKTDSKKSLVIDYSSRINEALSIRDNKITMIYLRLLPGAKPYQPMLPYKSDTKDMADFKYNHFKSSYAVIIHRNSFFNDDKFNRMTSVRGVQETDIAGLKRYVETECYDIEELKTHSSTTDQKMLNVDLQRALDNIASKAKDDHSPENCYENRAGQFFFTSPEKSLYITCGETVFCNANIGLQGRNVQMMISEENSIIEYKRKIITTRDPKAPFKTFPQPLLDQVWTDIPKWREKVDPTRTLLNNFVINEMPKNLESSN